MDRVERVTHLKRADQESEAIPLLLAWLDETEEDPFGVAPWPYEQLAIIHRKSRDLGREQEVLERFASQRHSPGAKTGVLLERLKKVYELQGQLDQRLQGETAVVWHREHDAPLDGSPPFRRRGLVLDVETTGLSGGDEIIELGAVLFEFSRYSGRVMRTVDRYRGLREPQCQMSPGAARVHGIAPADLRGQQLDRGKISEMITSADMLFAHNASFDRRFVNVLFPVAQNKPWYCTMRGVSWKSRGFSSRKLDDLLVASNVPRSQSHRALDDAEALLSLISIYPDAEAGRTYLFEVVSGAPLRPAATREPADAPDVVAAASPKEKARSGCIGAVVVMAAVLGAMLVLL